MKLDAYEYLAVVHEAHQQLTFGTDVPRLTQAVEALRHGNPDHVMIRLLEAKLHRMATIRQFLDKSRAAAEVHDR